MADKNGTPDKSNNRAILFWTIVGVGVAAMPFLLIAVPDLEWCRRVVLIIFIFAVLIAVFIAFLIYHRLKNKDGLHKATQAIDSPPPVSMAKYLAKNHLRLLLLWVLILFIALGFLFLSIFPEQTKYLPGCGTNTPAPGPSPTPTSTLSEAYVDFIVTFKTGDQLRIPADGTLTLLPDDKIVIKASVSNADRSPFPGDLIFWYFFASGGKTPGDTATYMAEQSGEDILTLWTMDKTSNAEIYRSIRITVK